MISPSLQPILNLIHRCVSLSISLLVTRISVTNILAFLALHKHSICTVCLSHLDTFVSLPINNHITLKKWQQMKWQNINEVITNRVDIRHIAGKSVHISGNTTKMDNKKLFFFFLSFSLYLFRWNNDVILAYISFFLFMCPPLLTCLPSVDDHWRRCRFTCYHCTRLKLIADYDFSLASNEK